MSALRFLTLPMGLLVLLLTACRPHKPSSQQTVSDTRIVLPPASALASSVAPEATPPPATPAPATAAVNSASPASGDPIDSSEIERRFLSTINEAIKKAEPGLKTPRTTYEGNVAHTVYAEYTGKYVYDIKKSDSIVFPLRGTVSWSVRWVHNGVASDLPTTLDAHYGYQNGRWIIRDLSRRINDEKSVPADEYLPLFQ